MFRIVRQRRRHCRRGQQQQAASSGSYHLRHQRHRALLSVLVLMLVWLACGVQLVVCSGSAYKCSRTPEGHGAMQTPADGRFHVRIAENAARYTPGQTYSIRLEGIDAGIRQMPQPLRHKFSGFILVVENKSGEPTHQDVHNSAFGVFSLLVGSSLTKITCANTVTHTTTTPKADIEVLWTAPPPGSGCVVFRATVIEHRDVWYMDDGPLTKEFCEDEQTLDDTLSGIIDPCCACAEAKYELTFEGLWSRNTHPKDFPSNNWLTRFSDIIGATHTADYSFWRYGDVASQGLKQVAEHGATKELESELKARSDNIRTIIKARGLAFPNVTGKTFAVFRVDQLHHVMSFVSMIDPSPDWFLGVSSLELCLANCTWVESKVLDLYPWDAGTDSGPTYISPDQPTSPADNIRRIRPDQPNDPRSPFYEPNAYSMKPLARLYLLRQRLYEKNCPEEQEQNGGGGGGGGGGDGGGGGGGNGNGGNEASAGAQDSGAGGGGAASNPCATTPWNRFGRCSHDCPKGWRTRQRTWVNEDAAQQAGCRNKLQQREECSGKAQTRCDEAGENAAQPPATDEEEHVTEAQCALTQWSDWSDCVPKCGPGKRVRRRKYVQKRAKKKCEGGDYHPVMMQEEVCENPTCVGEITPSEEEQQQRLDNDTFDDNDENNENNEDDDGNTNNNNVNGYDEDNDVHFSSTPAHTPTPRPEDNDCLENWTPWTPCTLTCGGGKQVRYRRRKTLKKCKIVRALEDSRYCNETPCHIPNFCWDDPIDGGCRNANATNMYFFNRNHTRCDVFTWTCGRHRNRFETDEHCMQTCTGLSPELMQRKRDNDQMTEELEQERRHRKQQQNRGGRNRGGRPWSRD